MSWVRGKGTIQVAAALLMLAVLGSAIAMWSDALDVMVTVDTGTVDVEFGTYSTNDPPGTNDPGYGIDVGTCQVTTGGGETDEDDNKADLDLIITITNAYPGYTCRVDFQVRNVGTIPVRGPYITIVDNTFSSAVTYTDNMGTLVQINPGNSASFYIEFQVTGDADEDTTYELHLRLTFYQWNMAPG